MFFKKLFSLKEKHPKRDQSLLIEEIGQTICSRAVSETNKLITRNDNIPRDRDIAVSQLFCQGLISLTDRVAHNVLPSNQRAEVMDLIMFVAAAHLIKEFSDDSYSMEEVNDLVNRCVKENNEMLLFLGQFSKYTVEADEDLEGNFFWEFGKVFSKIVGDEKNTDLATLAADSLMDIFGSMNINSTFKSLQR